MVSDEVSHWPVFASFSYGLLQFPKPSITVQFRAGGTTWRLVSNPLVQLAANTRGLKGVFYFPSPADLK